MKISHGLEYAAIWSLTKFVQIIPGRAADWIAIGLGKLAHTILRSRRKVAHENIRSSSLGIEDENRIDEIVRKVFVNIARTTIEFCRQPIYTGEDVLRIYGDSEGADILRTELDKGKGAMFISPHFGNWELLGGWLKAMDFPVDFLIGKQHNPKVDAMFVSFRQSLGVTTYQVGVAARKVLKSLRSGRMVAVVSDQHAASGGVVVNFLGRKASTPAGPAAFAVRAGSPVVCGCSVRRGYNRHKAVIYPPIYPPNTGDSEKDIQIVTQQYTERFEEMIRKYPEQWMWTHRRWKVD